ncbi:hypothetical protein ABKW74_19000 [Acinetobacter baumannii]
MNKSKFSYAVDFNNEIVGTLSAKEYFSMALLHKPICKGFFSDIIFK